MNLNLNQEVQKTSQESAENLDRFFASEGLDFQDHFVFPAVGKFYFAGHSLGLMPKNTVQAVQDECDRWGRYGVEGHFEGPKPWLPYHENVTASLASLVGAKDSEVVAMNSLTVNLHLAMVSFYRPTAKRFKILIEANTFPSDVYAVKSQLRFHGFSPEDGLLVAPDRDGIMVFQDLEAMIRENRDQLALVLLGNCNYLSGQNFPLQKISHLCHELGIVFGVNLAHGAGNLHLQLHDWDVDFAVWCSYKYLNSGPGGIAGAFVHERHLGNANLPRFEGWWGQNKATRFLMGPKFDPIPTVEAWQLSNPPIFQLASLRSSLDFFDKVGMKKLREKGDFLTSYLENQLNFFLSQKVQIVTPGQRGSMLSMRFGSGTKQGVAKLKQQGILMDFREPNIVRATPAPLYTRFIDVWQAVQAMKEVM